MKILNKIVEFIKSLIFKVRKSVHTETPVTSEKKVEEVESVETTEQVEPVKSAKRRGRPRKVKAE